ncbi:transcription factor ces-2-like isoform X3 [Mytilus trossulus]|uniref:transcription factor ces-2-like isoform X3 n=1 Tax=Mytilus trossulus TaxID=6551 RepID=UPI003003D5AE
MAESDFCEFPPGMDPHIMAQLQHFSQRTGAENFGNDGKTAGYYMDSYNTADIGSPDRPKQMRNPAVTVHHRSNMDTIEPSLHHDMSLQNYLAKPVAMRRLSEKSISHARSSLISPDAVLESMYNPAAAASASPTLARALAAVQQTQKRPRSEKKAIPNEQKDGKYFERRKRNNNAAKKSRDARKSREDEIAIRASFLEKENAILRAQVGTLREEASSLKHLLLQKRGRT